MPRPWSLEPQNQARASEECLPHLTLQSEENESPSLALMFSILRTYIYWMEAREAQI
jgi:hypothetical protein